MLICNGYSHIIAKTVQFGVEDTYAKWLLLLMLLFQKKVNIQKVNILRTCIPIVLLFTFYSKLKVTNIDLDISNKKIHSTVKIRWNRRCKVRPFGLRWKINIFFRMKNVVRSKYEHNCSNRLLIMPCAEKGWVTDNEMNRSISASFGLFCCCCCYKC